MKKKIKALIELKNKSQVDIAPKYNMSKESFNNKLRSAETRFNLSDLVKLAELTDTQLCFVDKKTGDILIKFDSEDIKKDTQ